MGNISEQDKTKLVIDDLNQKFYANFDIDYFTQKADYLLILLSDLDYISSKMETGIEYGKIKAKGEALSTEEKGRLRKNLESEIFLTYYHAVETLFRLLIAHAANVDCPWIEISATRNFSAFKKKVENLIVQQKLALAGKNFDESLILLFFGSDLSEKVGSEKWEKNISNLQDLLDHFARNLLETPHYNSYKHGLAIFQSQLGFELNEMLRMDKQDTLTFLEFKKKNESDDEKYIAKTHHFLKWEEKYALTYAVTDLIKNLVGVASMRYCKKEKVLLKSFDQYDLNKILVKNEYGVIMDAISMSL